MEKLTLLIILCAVARDCLSVSDDEFKQMKVLIIFDHLKMGSLHMHFL